MRLVNPDLPKELLGKDMGLNPEQIKKKRDIEALFSNIAAEAVKVSQMQGKSNCLLADYMKTQKIMNIQHFGNIVSILKG